MIEMDSGNSGSIQSSTGGDDDYDSRAAVSSLGNVPSSTTTTNNNNQLLFSQSSAMFDPLSNYFDPPIPTRPLQTHQNSVLDLDMATWSKSQPNPFLTAAQTPMSFPQETIATTTGNNSNQVVQGQSSQSGVAARNPKKRSRASRRAPTTVLTTDTSNFRAMVQEFTGIPPPPFSSPFPRTRLDLFTSPTPRSQPYTFHHTNNLPRPFPHKIQPPLLPFNNTSKPLNNMQIQNLTFETFLQSDHQFGMPSNTNIYSDGDGSGYNYNIHKEKLNISGGKADDNVSASGSTTRGEGLMESWICSSD